VAVVGCWDAHSDAQVLQKKGIREQSFSVMHMLRDVIERRTRDNNAVMPASSEPEKQNGIKKGQKMSRQNAICRIRCMNNTCDEKDGHVSRDGKPVIHKLETARGEEVSFAVLLKNAVSFDRYQIIGCHQQRIFENIFGKATGCCTIATLSPSMIIGAGHLL
jgi:hypothetical protein